MCFFATLRVQGSIRASGASTMGLKTVAPVGLIYIYIYIYSLIYVHLYMFIQGFHRVRRELNRD